MRGLSIVLVGLLGACVANGDGASTMLPCSGTPVDRCDPATCDHCFEIIPGYRVCAAGPRTSGSATACAIDQSGAPLLDSCCDDSECDTGLWCMKGVSDAQSNFPPNTCMAPDECNSTDECATGEVCVPPFFYNLVSRCEPAECATDSECAAGEICAPTLLDQSGGNHGPSFASVRCVPDPTTCTP